MQDNQMNKDKQIAVSKTFNTIDGNTLMAQEFEPLCFAVDEILPHGLFIMAGSGKVGKSWLALNIGVAVATGGELWDFSSGPGDVLYLALEDNHRRLQARLKMLKANNVDISRLHLTTSSFGISSGMLEQTHNFLKAQPDTKLIVVDTLERIRDTEYDKNIYSCDYRDMTALREITNLYKLTLLLVHHTRKMYDPDPLNTLSGSTGLVGAVDGVFVLDKETRTGNKAKLTIVNRDTESYCFNVEFNSKECRWLFIGNENDLREENKNRLCLLIDDFLNDSWRGTATELCDELGKLDGGSGLTPLNITKQLKSRMTLLKDEFNIDVSLDRNRDVRLITLVRQR